MRTLRNFAFIFAALIVGPSPTARAQQSPEDPYYAMPAPQPPPPGYPQPAYPQPGYAQPGYAQPGYAQPGAPQPGYPNGYPSGYTVGDGQVQAPSGDDGIGYDDAAAEAAEEAAAEESTYTDDGYDEEAYLEFQATLSPYGQWVQSPDYGQVWMPSQAVVGADFSPYASGGRWSFTEYGWTWVSDWDWGWAPFHYGRWWDYPGRGWCWVPGRKWGPSWVSWRWGGGYAGWAPLGPRGYVHGAPRMGGASAWHFTRSEGLMHPHPTFVEARAVAGAWSATSPLRNTQVVNRYRVEAGPAAPLVAGAVGHPIQPTSVHSFAAAAPRATIAPRGGGYPGAAPFGARSLTPTHVGTYPGNTTIGAHPYASAAPGYRAQGSYAPSYQQPAFRPYSPPAYRAPSYGYAAPAYRPPSGYSAPAYRAASSGYAAPAYRAPSSG